jgi:predicted nucleotidyltransferase
MNNEPRIPIDRDKIAEFCKKHGIIEFSLFGSVLRDDFGPDSDVDVMISLAPQKQFGLFKYGRLVYDLGQLFRRDVDVVLRKEIEASANPFRKKEVLSNYHTIYVA